MKQLPGNVSSSATDMDCSHWMSQLVEAWKVGEWAQCLSLAKHITTHFPDEGLAWKLLGSLYQQQDQLAAAVEAFQQAAKSLKKDAEVFYNLANVYAQLQEHTQAIKSYRQTLKLNPAFSRAYANWASVLKQTGQLKEAEKVLRRGLNIHQQDGRVNFELATLLHEAGKPLESIQYYREAAAIEPGNAVIFFNMAMAFERLHNEPEAILAYETAIANQPDYVEAYSQLGALYLQQGHFEQAEQWLLAGITLRPKDLSLLKNLAKLYRVTQRTRDYQGYVERIMQLQDFNAEQLNNVAAELLDQQLYAEAERYCHKALEQHPDNPYIYGNLGLIENARSAFDKACERFEQALHLLPDSEVILSNYSISLRMLGRYSEAVASLEKAIALKPDYAAAYINLASIYLDLGKVEQAIETLEKVLESHPEHVMALRNLLFSDSYINHLSPEKVAAYVEKLGRLMMQNIAPFQAWHLHRDDQRLRIGIVSADLRRHPVGYFIENWFKHFDPAKLEIYAYSTDGREDIVSHALKGYCNQWRSLAGLTDAQAADLIHEDGIHILLDLSGLTGGTRLPIFAWKPAPVQATWLGYWGTTGLPAMDYLIADPISVDAQVAQGLSEQVAYLPHTRMCFTAPPFDIPVNALPAAQAGHVTFGCYQNYTKVTDEVLQLWGEIFKALPEARLRWQCKAFNDDAARNETIGRLQQVGIAATRCELLGMVTREAYLQSHHAVDMILDTFPFTGGTTTCEALWMGVPTLTWLGDTLIGRQGASMLTCAGLPEWIARTKQEYVQKAIDLASDHAALAALRQSLRARVIHSPLMNAAQFAHDLEQLLYTLWQQKLTTLAADQLQADQAVQQSFAGQQPVWIVSATRMTEQDFWRDAALGQSLRRHMRQDTRLVAKVAYENTRGLSEIFNEALDTAPEDALLVYIHDDVWIDENTFVQTLLNGLTHYDVIGVAGNARRQPAQPGWCFVDTRFTWDDAANLRGAVAHGQHAFGPASIYGEMTGSCELMDGVFMAAHKRSLIQAGARHDPQFDFDFYDLDFCRSVVSAGLKLGAWPVRLTHQSGGNFGKQRWHDKYQAYLRKWEPAVLDVSSPQNALEQAVEEVFDLALDHHQRGEYSQAVQLYNEILQIAPQHALSIHNLGLLAWNAGDQPAAIARFSTAYQRSPQSWQMVSSYLTSLAESGDHARFQEVYQQALAQGHSESALRALATQWNLVPATTGALTPALPDQAEQAAIIALFSQQRYPEMELALQQMLVQYPAWLTGWKMLADVSMIQKKDARPAAEKALALNEQDAKEHCYYGIVLKAQGDLAGAAQAFEQAIRLQPDYAEAHNNLGTVLKDLGKVAQAIASFQQALALQPGYADCFSNLLFCMTHAAHVTPENLFEAHLAFAQRFEAPLQPYWPSHHNPKEPQRTLNIGWVSADLRAHSVAHFLLPLLPHLAKQPGLRLVAYANQALADEVTAQMRSYFHDWQEVSSLDDQALADQIRQDGIDILIDLSGHTAGNRLLTFARKPAPVQMSWLGYLNTTGLSAIDYYLADAALLPPGQFDSQFSETLVQLPVNATFAPWAEAPEVNALPAQHNGYITFGCFNRPNKITEATLHSWAALLQQLPDSRLIIGGISEGEGSYHLQAWFAQAGIDSSRVRYYPRTDMASYLGYYHAVDICLDTFPSNGVTTTAHALWMGVPTLCTAGDRLASRGAMALMQHMGLPQWVAEDQTQWLAQARALCADVPALAALRAGMRQRFSESLLAQPASQAQALAGLFRQVWQRWCQQQEKTAIQIPRITTDGASPPTRLLEPDMLAEEMVVPDTTHHPDSAEPLAAALEMARNLHAQGDIDRAGALYRQILQSQPQHAEANHQLGWIETHTLGVAQALPRLEQAVLQQPGNEQYWVSYIDALLMQGLADAALAAIKQGQQYALSAGSAATLLNECLQLASQQAAARGGEALYAVEQLQQVLFTPVNDTPAVAQAEASAQAACHAEVVAQPVQWLNRAKPDADLPVFPEAWLQAYPQSLMIEYTSRCNLRCKYCSKSNPGDDQIPGRNMDMTPETVDAVIALIEASNYTELLLAGTGESTFHPHWREDFPRLIQAGKSRNPACYVHVNSNFAAKYEDEDWAVFAQLDGIVISIDTADRQLTREVRAKSDLGLIIYNITRLQTYCQFHGLKLPQLTVNVTLYHEAAAGLPELMAMLSNLPIQSVSISDLFEREATDKNAIRPLHNDDPESFAQAVQHLKHAMEIAGRQQRFSVSIQPHLLERIEAMAGAGAPVAAATVGSEPATTGVTKMCLQPWSRFTLAADAAIFPCCMTEMDPVGKIDTGRQEDGLNGEGIRAFRHALLRGDMPSACRHCTNAHDVSPQVLQAAVNELSRKANA